MNILGIRELTIDILINDNNTESAIYGGGGTSHNIIWNLAQSNQNYNLYVGGINLIPFKEMLRYSIGSLGFIKNTIGNIVLFVPYGFFCFYYTKEKRISIGILVACIASFCIELVQFLIGRSFDIDDIILNVFGAIIGFLLYKLLFFISKIFNIEKYHIVIDILTFILVIVLIVLVGWWLK